MFSNILDDGIEILLVKPDDFLKVKETLTRIGVASKKDKTLYQSVHILHKKDRYWLLHFKELFALDGKPTNISENDVARRNTIANLLAEWNLLKLVDGNKSKEPVIPIAQLKILPFREKSEWNLQAKYSIGKKIGVKKDERYEDGSVVERREGISGRQHQPLSNTILWNSSEHVSDDSGEQLRGILG